jgi:hypothetical protein
MGSAPVGRVDLEKMRRAYEESRERTKQKPVLTQGPSLASSRMRNGRVMPHRHPHRRSHRPERNAQWGGARDPRRLRTQSWLVDVPQVRSKEEPASRRKHTAPSLSHPDEGVSRCQVLEGVDRIRDAMRQDARTQWI